MKKFLALLLTLVMALSLVACGGSSNSSDTASIEGVASSVPSDIFTRLPSSMESNQSGRMLSPPNTS